MSCRPKECWIRSVGFETQRNTLEKPEWVITQNSPKQQKELRAWFSSTSAMPYCMGRRSRSSRSASGSIHCLKFGTALKHFQCNSVIWNFFFISLWKSFETIIFFFSVLGMGRTGFKSYPPQRSYWFSVIQIRSVSFQTAVPDFCAQPHNQSKNSYNIFFFFF